MKMKLIMENFDRSMSEEDETTPERQELMDKAEDLVSYFKEEGLTADDISKMEGAVGELLKAMGLDNEQMDDFTAMVFTVRDALEKE